MSTIVQSQYSDGIAVATAGMIADETDYSVATKLCETAAGIPFGRVVSQSGVQGVTLGGATCFGISVRDITLNGVPLSPLADDPTDADLIDYQRNLSVCTRGHIWVPVDDTVAAGDSVYYDYTDGKLGNSASGKTATGYIDFTAIPANNQTVTLGGVATTFKTSGANGTTEINISPVNVYSNVKNLCDFLNASSNDTLNDNTYGIERVESGAVRLTMAHDTVGTDGNTFSIATTVTGATRSAATMSGGYAGDYATGDIVWHANPADHATVTFNGTAITFHTSGAAGDDVNIGVDVAATVDALVTKLNASVDAQISKCTYTATGTPHDTLHIVSDTIGTANNAFTLAVSSSPDCHATPSASTLLGGKPAATALSTAKWIIGALAGHLALLSLSYQR